jgi:hypothetical protein
VNKLLRLLVSATLLAWLAWGTDWAQVRAAFAQLRPGLWLLAVGVYAVAQVVSGLRWQMLARPLGFAQPLGRYISYYYIGMFFNLILPTSVGGDVVRAWYLDGGSGRRLAAFLSVFIDRCSGLLVLLALACGALWFCPPGLPAWVTLSVWGTAGCAALGLAGLPLLGRWTARLDRFRLLGETAHTYLGQPRLLLVVTVLSLGVQAANVVIVWLVGCAIDAPVPAGYYWVVVPMVTLLTLLPISLNGMGIREGGMVLFLAPLNIPSSTALSLSFLWFAVFSASSLFGAVIYALGYYPRPCPTEEEVQLDHESVRRGADQGRTGKSPAAA